MSAPLTIAQTHWEQMRAHVAAQAPLEACGILAGVDGNSAKVYVIENELRSPTRFRMAPKAQLEALLEIEDCSWDLLAIYHSHPTGPAQPSATDLREATFPHALHIIWSRKNGDWTANAFRLKTNSFQPIPIMINSIQ